MEKMYCSLSDTALEEEAHTLKQAFLRSGDAAGDGDRAFALVRQVALRRLGLHPYREQIAGALALNDGCIAEMATGEGKTLVATLPAVLAGWRGRGCHVITANDYLAERDARLMTPIYRFCGLTVGCITPGMAPAERKAAYNAHVTYCTNKEVAADFLRDRLAGAGTQGLPKLLLSKMVRDREDRIGRLVQRGLEYAIVDEADAIFIDEASTPLLISGEGPNQEQVEAYKQAAWLAAQLDAGTHYRVLKDRSTVTLNTAGKQRIAELADSMGGLWTGRRRREELVLLALAAKAVYIRDKHYVVDDDKVVIVDENTGRLMPDRTWRNGLHQAVEAKEGLEVNLPKETYARISFQRFYRLYRKLSGMSGTVAEARDELWATYQSPVVEIPTHRPCLRKFLPDRVFATAPVKWHAVVAEIERIHRTGRPVLVGTGSISDSERLSDQLTDKGLDHCLLNAVQHAAEARIIAEAGRMGRITVSTNMAGRGTDIKLGPGVAELGGLHVIATERFSARRIDRQFSGRSARHGDPGSNQVFVSLEDEIIQKDTQITSAALRRLFKKTDFELRSAFWRWLISAAQKRAERLSYRMRRDVMAADTWLDQHMGFAVKE
jgi:preprotein translocase subunit SecA